MNEMKGDKDKNMRNKINISKKTNLKNLRKSSKGITLIALVITIVVLLILAAVSIATLTGKNGILTRANESKTQTEIGEEKEAIGLAYNGAMAKNNGSGVSYKDLNDEFTLNGRKDAHADGANPIIVTFDSGRIYEIDKNGNIIESKPPITLEQAKDDSMLKEDTNSKVTVADGIVTLPGGFQIAQDSGNTIDDGIVIEDRKNNQFVWVPVSQENFGTEFVRRTSYYNNGQPQTMTNYGEVNAEGSNVNISGTTTGLTESSTTVQESKEMYDSVYKNEGFYIGRYEAGKDNSGNVVVQTGANVYNNVPWSKNQTMNEETETTNTQDGAIELARNFDEANEYTTVKSTLCYGVQWDRALSWIDPEYEDFAKISTGQGNYNEDENTNPWKGDVAQTGSSTDYEVNKIYDLAGNVREWTMESNSTFYRVGRGRLLQHFRLFLSGILPQLRQSVSQLS